MEREAAGGVGTGGETGYWADAVVDRVTAGNVEIFDHNKLFTMTMTMAKRTTMLLPQQQQRAAATCSSNVQQAASRTARPARIPRVEMRKAVANCELFCLGSVRQKLVFYNNNNISNSSYSSRSSSSSRNSSRLLAICCCNMMQTNFNKPAVWRRSCNLS